MTKGIDLYTKIVLTVIAVCLTYIVTKDIKIIPEAVAQSHAIDNGHVFQGKEIQNVNIVSVGGSPVGSWVPVKMN